jgi:hypothetical protein
MGAKKREAVKNLTSGQKHAFIGFYSKRRKTTMQVIHLGRKELAERWRMSEATLERWRSDRIGPVFLKIRGRVLYRHVDIEAFEVASLKGTFVEQGNHALLDGPTPTSALVPPPQHTGI